MRFSDCLSALKNICADFADVPDFELSVLTNKTSGIVPGSLFCAIRGAKFDGHDFLFDAVKSGAVAFVVHESCPAEKIPQNVPLIRVSDSYAAWGILCALSQGFPADHFRVHGITGTNGKTSTAIL